MHVRWYVAAPWRTALNAQSVPFGVRHARQAGGRFTACGLPALNWPMFWEAPFTPSQPAACPDCAQFVLDEMRQADLARHKQQRSARAGHA